MATTQDIEYYIGEDKSIRVTIYNTSGTAEDITNWALSWMVKKKLGDADNQALLTKTTVAGTIALTTPGSGICTISVLDTDTDSFSQGTYYHELKRTDAGSETILMSGRLTLRRGVHRS